MIPILALTVGEPLVLTAGTTSPPESVEGFEKPPWPDWERAESVATLEVGQVHRAPSYGPVTYRVQDDWIVVDDRMAPAIYGPDGQVTSPQANCTFGLRPMGVLASPPRAVLRCQDKDSRGQIHSLLWSPSESLRWTHEGRSVLTNHQGLNHPVLPEGGENPEYPAEGLPPALLDTYTRWVDLERMRLFTSEPLDVVHLSIRGIPEQGFLRRLPEETLYWGDFSTGELRPVEGLPWCPGQLVERDREGSRVLLHCTSQADPKLYRFTIEWGAVVDVEQGIAWQFSSTPERIQGDVVVLSERKAAAAESRSAHGKLTQVTLSR